MATKRAHGKNMLLLIGGGLAAGLINGLLGAGGGIIVVFLLGNILGGATRQGSSVDSRDLFANALAAMLPVTVISLISYAFQGTVTLQNAEILIVPSIIGGIGGALLLDRLKVETAKRIFTLIMIVSGIIMLVRG